MNDIATQTAQEMATELSQKNGTLVAIYQLGGYVREVSPIVEHLRAKLNINTDGHNVAHVMWPLSKENKITFLERKERGKSFLTNIKITERGAATVRELLGMEVKAADVGRVIPAGRGQRIRAAHAVGQDMTDFRRHGAVAVGGPIEHALQKETVLDSVPFVILDEEEAKQYRETPSRTIKQRTASSSTDGETAVEVSGKSTEVDEKPAEADGMAASTDTHTEYPDDPRARLAAEAAARAGTESDYAAMAEEQLGRAQWQGFTFRPERFPQIAAVLAKREKVQRYRLAAETLADDEPEIAIQLLSKVEISPLEEEIIRLLG